jgi:hypothetical protein
MYFDGSSGSGIRIPQSDDFDFGTGAFTIRGWVKPSSASGNEVIFSTTEWNGNNNADGTALMLRKSGSKWYINATKTDYSGWEFETASSSNVTTSWQHFVVTKASGTAPVKLIIDGTTEVTTSNITSIASTSGFNYKDFFIGGFIGGQRFTGYISDFEVLKGESTTTSPINSEITKSTNTKLLLLGTTAGLFTDSATSGTTHTITPTGSYHSQDHGGIAPAMTWPASLKKTGSAGIYFDGTGDYLDLPDSADFNFGTGAMTIDFWFYCTSVTNTTQNMWSGWTGGTSNQSIYLQKDSSANSFSLRWYQEYSGATSIWYTADGAIQLNTWYHVGVTRSGSTLKCFINGVDTSITVSNAISASDDLGDFGTHNIGRRGDGANYFIGYIDSFRIQKGVAQTFTTSPTQIYGAMFPTNPSVGTITITGATTDSTDIAFTEINNSLPNGLTLNDQGAGNQTATITGTLTDFVTSDTTTSNIRIQAKANNDANRITEVNESSGVGAVSITKKAGGEPVLFNARRYIGTNLTRDLTNLGMQSDLVWFKRRDSASPHRLSDTVTGLNGYLASSAPDPRYTDQQYINNITSDGFEVNGGTGSTVNADGGEYIAWAWKAGGAPTATNSGGQSPTPGSVMINGSASIANLESATLYPKKMSINTSAGFSDWRLDCLAQGFN